MVTNTMDERTAASIAEVTLRGFMGQLVSECLPWVREATREDGTLRANVQERLIGLAAAFRYNAALCGGFCERPDTHREYWAQLSSLFEEQANLCWYLLTPSKLGDEELEYMRQAVHDRLQEPAPDYTTERRWINLIADDLEERRHRREKKNSGWWQVGER